MTAANRRQDDARRSNDDQVTIVAHARSAPGQRPPVTFGQTAHYSPAGAVQHSHGDTLHFAPGSGRHELIFEIDDQTGLGLHFPDSAHEAIWIAEADECPSTPGHDTDFVDGEVREGRLTIHNLNAKQARLHYILNFEDRDGNRVQYDPIINNGGGGTTRR